MSLVGGADQVSLFGNWTSCGGGTIKLVEELDFSDFSFSGKKDNHLCKKGESLFG